MIKKPISPTSYLINYFQQELEFSESNLTENLIFSIYDYIAAYSYPKIFPQSKENPFIQEIQELQSLMPSHNTQNNYMQILNCIQKLSLKIVQVLAIRKSKTSNSSILIKVASIFGVVFMLFSEQRIFQYGTLTNSSFYIYLRKSDSNYAILYSTTPSLLPNFLTISKNSSSLLLNCGHSIESKIYNNNIQLKKDIEVCMICNKNLYKVEKDSIYKKLGISSQCFECSANYDRNCQECGREYCANHMNSSCRECKSKNIFSNNRNAADKNLVPVKSKFPAGAHNKVISLNVNNKSSGLYQEIAPQIILNHSQSSNDFIPVSTTDIEKVAKIISSRIQNNNQQSKLSPVSDQAIIDYFIPFLSKNDQNYIQYAKSFSTILGINFIIYKSSNKIILQGQSNFSPDYSILFDQESKNFSYVLNSNLSAVNSNGTLNNLQLNKLETNFRNQLTQSAQEKLLTLCCGCRVDPKHYFELSFEDFQEKILIMCRKHDKTLNLVEMGLLMSYYIKRNCGCKKCNSVDYLRFSTKICCEKYNKTNIITEADIKIFNLPLAIAEKEFHCFKHNSNRDFLICFFCGEVNIPQSSNLKCKNCKIFESKSNDGLCKSCKFKNTSKTKTKIYNY